MKAFSKDYLDSDPVIVATNIEIYEYDQAVYYAEQILQSVFDIWRNDLEKFWASIFGISIGILSTIIVFFSNFFKNKQNLDNSIDNDD